MGKPIKGIHFIAIARSAGAVILTAPGTSSRGGRASSTSSHNLYLQSLALGSFGIISSS